MFLLLNTGIELWVVLMRIRFMFVTTVIGVGLVVFSIEWFHLPEPVRINEESYSMIKPGMTRTEVNEILGAPPGDHMKQGFGLVMDLFGNGVLMREGVREEWWGDNGIIQVGFDEADTALWVRFVPVYR